MGGWDEASSELAGAGGCAGAAAEAVVVWAQTEAAGNKTRDAATKSSLWGSE